MRRTYGDWDFGGNSILRVRIHPGETFYGTPEEGQAMYHLGLKGLYVWNGTEWIACSTGAITLDQLVDVNVASATSAKQFLGFVPAAGSTAAYWTAKAVNLGDLGDVDLTGATEGQVLTLVGGVWKPTTVSASGGGTSGGAHRYWRLLVARAQDGAERVGISELRFLRSPNEAQIAPTGGTALGAITPYMDRTPAKAFDGNAATMWMPQSYGPYLPGADVGYDFGAAREIVAVAVTVQPETAWGVVNAPYDFAVQYSDDGAAWTTQWSVAAAPFATAGQTIVFTDPAYVAPTPMVLDDISDVDVAAASVGQALVKQADGSWQGQTLSSGGGGSLPAGGTTGQVLTKVSDTDGDAGWATPSGGGGGGALDVGAHRYWMLDNISANGAVSIAEIGLRATAGGANHAISAAQAKDSYDAGSTGPNKAFDGNAGTFWAGNSMPNWFFVDLGSAQTVVEVAITARNDGWHQQRPATFDLLFSDDGVVWKLVAAYRYPFCTVSGETLLVPVPATR